MATVQYAVELDVSAEIAWSILRELKQPQLAFGPLVTGCRVDDDVRIVTFASGLEVRERIITLDDESRRVCWTVLDRFDHYNAAISIIDRDDGRSIMLWICDVLPDDRAGAVRDLMMQGSEAFQRNVSAQRT